MEIHTTDLTAACLKSVELRWEGKRIGETTTALALGSLWHEAVRLFYVDEMTPAEAVDAASVRVAQDAAKEGRPLSSSAAFSLKDLGDQVREWLDQYTSRFGWILNSKRVGCELPVRMSADVDGEPVEFASHLDLLIRSGDSLMVIDWKTGEDAPTRDYLSRNMQLGMYAWAVRDGEVFVGGEWVSLGELPTVAWFHVRNLSPFKKATTAKDEMGNSVEYKKGDVRPDNKILITADIDDDGIEYVKREFATRVRMFRAGMFPTNPDPIGCLLCECRRDCPTFGATYANK